MGPIWAALVGCAAGPRAAVDGVAEALASGDRSAFADRVDEAAVDDVARACLALQPALGLADRQLRPPDPWQDALLPALAADPPPELVAGWRTTFLERFPELPVATCPALALDLGAATVAKRDADHATAEVPFAAPDHRGTWTWELARRDGGWRVVHVRADGLVDRWRAEELALARVRAAALAAGLADGAPHDDWRAVRFYADRHPEEAAIREALDGALARVERAPAPVAVSAVGFWKPRGLFRNRHVGARVENPTDRAATEVRVRFGLRDGAGAPLASDGVEALVVAVGPLAPGESRDAASPASGASWPSAVAVDAAVVEVTWADGSRWTHPAVAAGAWSPFPTQ